MKTRTIIPTRTTLTAFLCARRKQLLPITTFLLSLMILIPSCEKGDIGEPGLAFVEFAWVLDEPDYIEIENDFIPAVFYWNWFYRVDPGIYYVYYEGLYRFDRRLDPYAWELEYEVWENEGNPSKYWWEDSPDGPDAYFTIELSPHGPEVYYEEAYPDKSTSLEAISAPPEGSCEEIIIEKEMKNFKLRLKYKQVEPRNQESMLELE